MDSRGNAPVTQSPAGAKDTLVERLRAFCIPCDSVPRTKIPHEAADRIEQLERELAAQSDSSRIDWIKENMRLVDRLETAERERDKYKAALAELVRLKDLADEIDKNPSISWRDRREPWSFREQDYARLKPLAWEAARAAMQDRAQDSNAS